MSVLPDSSMAELNVVGIPVHMKYSEALNNSAVSGKRRKIKMYPMGTNQYNTSSNIATVNMNFGMNDLLDTSSVELHFTLTATAGTTDAYLDTSAFGIINRLQVRDNSGQVLDQIAEYGQLVQSLFTVQASKSAMDSSSVYGFPLANGVSALDGAGALLDLGEIASNQSYTFTSGGSVSHNLAVPLLGSAVFSAHLNNNQSYLPVCLLNGNALQVEFQFETNLDKVFKSTSTTPTAYSISNLYIECAITEVDPSVIRDFKNMIGQQELYLSSQMWTNMVYTPSGATSTYNVNASGRSIRSLLIAPQRTPAINTIASSKIPVTSLQSQINSEYYPSFPLTTIPELIDETASALGVSRASGMMNVKTFGSTNVAPAFAGAGAVIIQRCPVGLDYDRFRDSTKESGVKAQNALITVYLTATAQPATINNWVLQDCALAFNPVTGAVRNIYQ